MDFFTHNIDYWIFAGTFLAVFLAIHLRFRHRGASENIGLYAWMILVAILIGGWFLVKTSEEGRKHRLTKMIEGLAPTYAQELEQMEHEKITLETDPQDPAYLRLIEAEKRWLKANPMVADIYTMRKLPDGKNVFIVDSETDYDRNGKIEGEREGRTALGEAYDEPDEGLEKALKGIPNFDDTPITDRWGTWVSGWYPLFDRKGQVEGVVGVDYAAEDWKEAIFWARFTAIGFLSVLLAILAGSLFFNSQLRLEISKRREAEERTQKLAQNLAYQAHSLKLSNQDLEQFAYIASHDLQEPLRMIKSFSQLLFRRYQEKLDSEGKEFLNYVIEGVQGMEKLLQDLLQYSRIGTRAGPPESVDLNRIFQRVKTNLSVAIEESKTQITSDPLPILPVDASQMIQLFQNLIGNAIKFKGDKTPRIHLSAKPDGEKWLFSVSDNGIGVAPQYHERIFAVFQRLHSKGEYPGTGIGLAVCKKIIERHGGKIWLESEEGKGSTFYFALPKNGSREGDYGG